MISIQFAILLTTISIANAAQLSHASTPGSLSMKTISISEPENIIAKSNSHTLCLNCANYGCPAQCAQSTCVSKWRRCKARSKRCCSGWRCVWARNRRLGRRCEPPRPKCTPHWRDCRNKRCCNRWRCVRLVYRRRRKWFRCEPPRKSSRSRRFQ